MQKICILFLYESYDTYFNIICCSIFTRYYFHEYGFMFDVFE